MAHNSDNKTIALLVAAGRSERMGGDIPKPYLPLDDEPILRHTIKKFINHPDISGVRVVMRREDHARYKQAARDLSMFPCVVGGDSRQESVLHGLESISHRNPANVLIHDVARPMVDARLISRVVVGLEQHKAVIPALPVHDTVKRIEANKVIETVSREQLYTIQTPQGFDYQTLLSAHQKYSGESYTDDAALMEQMGIPIEIVAGSQQNNKITTAEDLKNMQTSLSLLHEMRIGQGYDVHTLKAHDPDTPVARQRIKLCGIKIPHTHHLVGNSDADVALHAMVDALLGAIGEGDIGTHFPPDDLEWKGADSARFLLHAYELIKARGGEIINIDLTIICERPKISEYRSEMIHHVAQLLKLDEDRISIKATTTEKLGFAGRSEGIAAQAVASVRLPRK